MRHGNSASHSKLLRALIIRTDLWKCLLVARELREDAVALLELAQGGVTNSSIGYLIGRLGNLGTNSLS